MKFPKKGTFLGVNLRHLFESGTYLRVALNGASMVFHKPMLLKKYFVDILWFTQSCECKNEKVI